MPQIRQLSPSVINKIAAGEVIERPASVVKELVENSIDAGATRIEVSLAQGGLECVRVADNGCGIAPEQLTLALASHATSKIADADDLFRVGTLGFRGEALASIAEVSRLLLRSRTAAEAAGAQIESAGGAITPPAPCGCSVGTSIEVRNLFFNTPVRRKFLRTTQTEMGHCSEAFTRLALAWPGIHFSLRHNDRTLFELPPVESWRDRIAVFFGQDLADGLIAVDSRDDDVLLSGYAANPQFSRSHNRMQYLFLNGRHIRDRALGHALQEAYRGLLLTGRQPIAFLRLAMPPDAVDVNVHPTKLEVRFQDGGRLYSQLLGCLRKKFLMTNLCARVGVTASPAAEEAAPGWRDTEDPSLDSRRQELVDWAKGQLSTADAAGGNYNKGGSSTEDFAGEPLSIRRAAIHPADGEEAIAVPRVAARLDLRYDEPAPTSGGLALHRVDLAEFGRRAGATSPVAAGEKRASAGGVADRTAAAPAPDETPARPAAERGARKAAVQLHNRYLVTENDEGMVVIDQHALHERVLYEQLKRKIMSGALETQRLLAPEPVALSPQEAAVALDARDLLATLGLEIEPFGGDTVVVRGYPAMVTRLAPGELLRQAVEQLAAGGQPDRRELVDELLHMIACKAAVKAGDPLTQEEVEALLAEQHLCQDSHHCPHGRPTALVFTRAELDRRFKRT